MPIKQNTDATPSETTLKLFCLLLFSGKEYSLSELAELMECSRQSIGRMMDKIDASGKGVVLSEKRDGQRWYRLKVPQGNRPRVSLQPHELTHMALCHDLLRHILPLGIQKELAESDSKTATLLQNYEAREHALKRKGYPAVKGMVDYNSSECILRALCEAIDGFTICKVKYHPLAHMQPKEYEFIPARIVGYRESLYVRGWKMSGGDSGAIAPRLFALHRILSISPTQRVLPDDVLASLPPLEESELFGLMAGNPFEVYVRFAPSVARYAQERTWGAEQMILPRSDGGVEIKFFAQSEIEIVKWVLGFGNEAELLAPAHLRKRIAVELMDMKTFYCE